MKNNNNMTRILKISILFSFIFISSYGFSQLSQTDKPKMYSSEKREFEKNINAERKLVAFSLNALKKEYKSDSDKINLHYKFLPFHKIWGMVIDDDDMIIIGERISNNTSRVPFISLNQVITSLITRSNSTNISENNGVSIEPFKTGSDRYVQKVIYSGEVEGTDYGRVVLEADILLKLLGQAVLDPKVEDLPREIDLYIDHYKSVRPNGPIDDVPQLSWFFPVNAIYDTTATGTGMVLNSLTIEVQNSFDKFVQLDSTSIDITEEKIVSIIENDPHALGALYARFLSRYFKELSQKYPILTELRNVYALSGMFDSILKNKSFKSQEFWEKIYQRNKVHTPKEVPALSYTVNGLAYSVSLSGKISGNYSINTDPWTRELFYGNPDVLRLSTIESRPSNNTISWIINSEVGRPNKWSENVKQNLQNEEREYFKDNIQKYEEENIFSTLDFLNSNPNTISNPNWKPKSIGKNLISFNSSFFVSSQEKEYSGYSGYWRVGITDLKLGANFKLNWIYKNKIEIELNAPFVWKWQVEDIPSLPGLITPIVAFNGGIESPSLRNRILILDGLDKNRKWNSPKLVLENSLEIPVSWKMFSGYLIGRDDADELDSDLAFGNSDWFLTHGIYGSYPLYFEGKIRYLRAFAGYVNNLKKKNRTDEQIILDFSVISQVKNIPRLYTGLRVSTSFVFDSDTFPSSNEGEMIIPGVNIVGSISVAEKYGLNTLGLGWMFINNDWKELRGGPILTFTLSGSRLWDFRKWY